MKTPTNKATILFLSNSAWMTAEQGIWASEALVRSIIVARVLGETGNYAVYAVVLAFASTVLEFFNLNIGSVIIKFGSEHIENNEDDKFACLLTAGYLLGFLISLTGILCVCFFLFFFYSVFFDIPNLQFYVIGISVAVCGITIDETNKAVLRLFGWFRVSCQIGFAIALFSMISFIIYGIYFGGSISGFLMLNMVASLMIVSASTIVTVLFLKKRNKPFFTTDRDGLWQSTKSFSKVMALNSSSMSIQRLMRKGDLLLLKVLSNDHAVATYDVAKKMSMSILFFRNPLALAAFPQIANLIAARNFKEIRNLLLGTYRFLLPLSILLLAIAFVFGEMIVVAFYGNAYQGTHLVFFFLTFVSLFYVLFFWANSFVLSLGRNWFQFIAHCTGLFAAVISAFSLVPDFGAAGMAISSFIGLSVIYILIGAVAVRTLSNSRITSI